MNALQALLPLTPTAIEWIGTCAAILTTGSFIPQAWLIFRTRQVEGEEMGHLPGELSEKFEPYLRPLLEIFREAIRPGVLREPQRGAADEARSLRGGRQCLGAIRADPR